VLCAHISNIKYTNIYFHSNCYCSAEATALKNRGVNILIALGHSGYDVDQQIGINCPDIDVVIGGHSNTFLYNGRQPDVEKIEGPYPTIVTQKSGKKVPIVQAYAYTKYLGHLKLNVSKIGSRHEHTHTHVHSHTI
jgi:2',3'-cyclic-nucleotide 2'-phosphodiesterase (5'-nucleotidase family)